MNLPCAEDSNSMRATHCGGWRSHGSRNAGTPQSSASVRLDCGAAGRVGFPGAYERGPPLTPHETAIEFTRVRPDGLGRGLSRGLLNYRRVTVGYERMSSALRLISHRARTSRAVGQDPPSGGRHAVHGQGELSSSVLRCRRTVFSQSASSVQLRQSARNVKGPPRAPVYPNVPTTDCFGSSPPAAGRRRCRDLRGRRRTGPRPPPGQSDLHARDPGQ